MRWIVIFSASAALAGCSEPADDSATDTTADTSTSTSGDASSNAASETPDTTPDKVTDAIGTATRLDGWDGVNNLFNDGRFYFAGQVDEASFKRFAEEKGIATVVNIRQESEMESLGFDEVATVEELGMTYVNIPVTTGTFSAEDVKRFADAVEATDGPLLLHCGSSNRVGAMWAAYLVIEHGMDVETAIERGRAAGLRSDSLVDAVNRVIAEGGG
ncbi:MAG: protein tyrosine phosphatase family protein [Planctomycetes bacterium]|nr:protein tyrosine phosphatase family protein [Planctomycetota bacterium]